MFKPIGSLFSGGKENGEQSSYGDTSFTEAKVKQSGLLDDLKAIGPDIGKDALTLIEKVTSKGEPYDDRTYLVHKSLYVQSSKGHSFSADGANHSSHGIVTTQFKNEGQAHSDTGWHSLGFPTAPPALLFWGQIPLSDSRRILQRRKALKYCF